MGAAATSGPAVDAWLLGVTQARFMPSMPGIGDRHMGFYGGINYGFGYVGVGFAGGRWVGQYICLQHYRERMPDTNVIHRHTYSEAVVEQCHAQ